MSDTTDYTPEQATTKLAEMSAAFKATQPVNPHTELEQKYSDPKFRAKLDGGSPEARAEFDQLVKAAAEADPIKSAMSGQLPDIPSSDLRQMSEVAGWLRDLGIRESVIEQALSGAQETQEAVDYVTQWKADRLADPEWTKRWLAGGEKEKREMVLASIVLAAGPKKEAA